VGGGGAADQQVEVRRVHAGPLARVLQRAEGQVRGELVGPGDPAAGDAEPFAHPGVAGVEAFDELCVGDLVPREADAYGADADAGGHPRTVDGPRHGGPRHGGPLPLSRALPGHVLRCRRPDDIRTAPSTRSVPPLIIGLSRTWATSAANSAGSPQRRGCTRSRSSSVRAGAGSVAAAGVVKKPGATVTTRMREPASSRASGSVMETMPPLDAA